MVTSPQAKRMKQSVAIIAFRVARADVFGNLGYAFTMDQLVLYVALLERNVVAKCVFDTYNVP